MSGDSFENKSAAPRQPLNLRLRSESDKRLKIRLVLL